jgi:hypothetical protein
MLFAGNSLLNELNLEKSDGFFQVELVFGHFWRSHVFQVIFRERNYVRFVFFHLHNMP